jgi:hypothetical protein
MDLQQIEYAAEIVFRMCREHPEICPHNYTWTSSTTNKEVKQITHRYVCSICGDTTSRIEVLDND